MSSNRGRVDVEELRGLHDKTSKYANWSARAIALQGLQPDDAAFIAAAHNVFPALLDEVVALREALAAWERVQAVWMDFDRRTHADIYYAVENEMRDIPGVLGETQ